MSDQGEKTCPLCAEEMDLTDQQLKPCKCGYEICVWCWHNIVGMAEKDGTEGRCPACRTPYDKEKIVGTASNCKRLAADANMEKKKSQKTKTRISDRKQLSSARVVRRNLVYIVGLPLSLADEDLLLRKEYFGQYGKVSKVSMSRTSAGTVQQFANNTCSVYITYSKEEEAARCIQSIHGFTLDGKCLRACFGTTKYCHAWLRNVTCTNPDCLYLHEIGSQEDSFTKDEYESAYSRVQQITGIVNNLQRRSGNDFPPPADGYCNINSTTTGKPIVRSTPNTSVSNAKVSPPSRSAGGTGALPATASWGTRASICQSSAGSLVCSNGPVKQTHDASCPPIAVSAALGPKSAVQSSGLGRKVMLDDDSQPQELKNKPKLLENMKQHTMNLQTNMSKDSHTPLVAHGTPVEKVQPPSPPVTLNNSKMRDSTEQSNVIGKQCTMQNSEVARQNSSSSDCLLIPGYQGLQNSDTKSQVRLSSPVSKAAESVNGASASRLDMQSSAVLNLQSEKVEDFDIQRLSDPMASQTSLFSSSHSFDVLDHLRSPSHQNSDAAGAVNHTVNLAVNKQDEDFVATVTSNPLFAPTELVNNQGTGNFGAGNSCVLPNGFHGIQVGASDNQAVTMDLNPGIDVMESSIISNILSLDLDGWDGSLMSQDLVKLLDENERQQGSFNMLTSRKAENSNQSRFSFARQEESHSQYDVEPSFRGKNPPLVATGDPYLDRLGNGFVIPQHNSEHYGAIGSSRSFFSSNKHPVSRSQISAPPGFSVHSRIPPPGFSAHGISDQTFNVNPGNHFLDSMSSLRNFYEASPCANSRSAADIEFIDRAILAVGKGRPPSSLSNSTVDMRPAFSPQTSAFENESRLQLLLQQSFQPPQNDRYTDARDYSPTDANLYSSRHYPLRTGNIASSSQFAHQPMNGMSNNHLDTWPQGMAGNNMGMTEFLRNNQLSFSKLYGGYDDSKFQISGSQDVYSRAFGM